MNTARKIADQEKLDKGYRVVINNGELNCLSLSLLTSTVSGAMGLATSCLLSILPQVKKDVSQCTISTCMLSEEDRCPGLQDNNNLSCFTLRGVLFIRFLLLLKGEFCVFNCCKSKILRIRTCCFICVIVCLSRMKSYAYENIT